LANRGDAVESLPNSIYLVHSARPSVSFTILSPPEDSRHISTSLPAGIGLAQVISGLLWYLVVENLQVTMQEASPASEFVIMMLANSLPGKITQLKGTDSAEAAAICAAARSASHTRARCECMFRGGLISLLPFSAHH
jgi:hypothetical protein